MLLTSTDLLLTFTDPTLTHTDLTGPGGVLVSTLLVLATCLSYVIILHRAILRRPCSRAVSVTGDGTGASALCSAGGFVGGVGESDLS